MAEELNKRALIEIDLDVDALNSRAADAKQKVSELAKEMKTLKDAGQENTAEYIALQGEMRSYQQVVTQAVNVNKQLTNTQNQNTGSIDAMRSQLSLVTRQYNSLSAEERNNIAVGGALLTQQRQLSDSLKQLESAGGNNTRNVGEYEESIKRALGTLNPFESQLGAVAQAFNSLKVVTAATAEAEVAAAAAREVAAVATAELTVANEALTIAEANTAAIQAELAVSTGTNTALQEQLTAVTLELTAAQEAQAGATAASAAANEASAAASATAAGSFKLFDNILKASIIGAIVAVVLLLINYLKSFDPLMDILEQAFAGFNAVLNVVVSAIKNFFTGLSNVGDLIKEFGNFLAHPIDTMNAFGNSMAKAAKDAFALKAAQQELEDTIRINEVKTAETQQRVAELILKARNRTLNNDQRKKYLTEAASLDKEDFERRLSQANEELRIATEQVKQRGLLNSQQLEQVKKGGLEAILQLQGDTKVRGKITDDEVDAYKKAQLAIISARDESTKRQEKIQNKIDADAEKAQAEQEKRAAKEQQLSEQRKKQNDEVAQSEQRTRDLSLSGREQEGAKIEEDYAKRIAAANGYNLLVKALERERAAQLTELRKKFAEQDAKDQNALNNSLYQGQQQSLKNNIEDLKELASNATLEAQETALTKLQQLHDLEAKQRSENLSFELAQNDLTQQQIAAIDEKYRQQELENNRAFEDERTAINNEFANKRQERAQQERDAIQVFEKSKRDTYSQGLELLTSIFGKQTALGKAAFLAQRAFTVAQIVLETQKQVAAIQTRAAVEAAQLALIPIIGIGLAAGRIAAGQVEAAFAIARGIIAGAVVVATTVQGFDRGGVYNSDGRGGLLSGYSRVDNINSRLRSGEAVVVSEAMRDPKARAVVSAINVAYGGRSFGSVNTTGGFASGGIFSSQFNANNETLNLQKYIQETAILVAQNMPRQILVVDEVQAKTNDNEYINNRAIIK